MFRPYQALWAQDLGLKTSGLGVWGFGLQDKGFRASGLGLRVKVFRVEGTAEL